MKLSQTAVPFLNCSPKISFAAQDPAQILTWIHEMNHLQEQVFYLQG